MNRVDDDEIDRKAGGHISKSESGVRDAFVISGQSRLFMGGGTFHEIWPPPSQVNTFISRVRPSFIIETTLLDRENYSACGLLVEGQHTGPWHE